MIKLDNNCELLDILATEDFLLKEAWAKVNKENKQSFGISGENIEKFAMNLETKIPSLSKKIKGKTFHFSPTRPYIIPKNNGQPRPLQIPEVKDRVVLKGIALLLEDCLSEHFAPSRGYSFAYQKKWGVKDAVLQMEKYYNEGYTTVLEADIIDFFPSVDKQLLLNSLFNLLPDQSLNDLITSALSQPIGELNELIPPEHHHLFHNRGIPQGNSISPILSNLYLTPFDKAMIDGGFKLIRYADDFIVMCKDADEARAAYQLAVDILENSLNLKLHPLSDKHDSKTKIHALPEKSFSFLSVAFDGKKLYPSLKAVRQLQNALTILCHTPKETPNVLKLLSRVKNTVDGWLSSYSYTDVERYEKKIDNMINELLLDGITRLGWKPKKSSLENLPVRDRGTRKSGEMLSKKQRENSGIPLSMDTLVARRKKQEEKKKQEDKKKQKKTEAA